MTDRYILNGREPVPEPDLLRWAVWFGTTDRRVAFTDLGEDVCVSTVFIGLDHSFGEGPPLLFETMVFGPYGDQTHRYSTWEEAEVGHKKVTDELRLLVKDTA